MPVLFPEQNPFFIFNMADDESYSTESGSPLSPAKKKSRIVVEVGDGTTNNTVSTLADSSQFMSPAVNTRSGGKKNPPPSNDVSTLSDAEEMNQLVDAALLSKNNPTDGEMASEEVRKLNEYERTMYEVVSRSGPRRSSPIWKYSYFKELYINRRGKRIMAGNRKFIFVVFVYLISILCVNTQFCSN
jgi:hypothetical protein